MAIVSSARLSGARMKRRRIVSDSLPPPWNFVGWLSEEQTALRIRDGAAEFAGSFDPFGDDDLGV